VNREAW
jgi:hypothetical protein